ncbi:MAG TPA: hypothetical protein VNA13_02995 [Xanthomonadales bacterium]|nr:hypothetical protein [Xanthomonadales bacterium]
MTEVGPSPVEAGQKAASLKEQVKAFAALEDEAARGQKLKEVVDFIANEADKDTMDNLVSPESPFQGRLAEAVIATVESPIKVNDDAESEEGWKGHGTAVVLTEKGEVIGTFNRPTGLESPLPGNKGNYGDLRRFALIKAMCSLHLEKAGKKGGMLGNYDYLEKEVGLTPYDTLFIGAADESVEVDGKKAFVATSGVEAKEGFIGKYLKSAYNLPEVPKVDRETLAGLFDGLAGNRIARNLVGPQIQRDPIVIPPNEMSRSN